MCQSVFQDINFFSQDPSHSKLSPGYPTDCFNQEPRMARLYSLLIALIKIARVKPTNESQVGFAKAVGA